MIKQRTLGRTGILVGEIGLGCEGFMGMPSEQAVALIRRGIKAGMNCFDMFTSNPEARKNLGIAIAGQREKVVIQGHLCTVWENGQYKRTRNIDEVKRGFDELCSQIGTDYIDIGMIHFVDGQKDYDEVFGGPIIEYAKQLKQQGRIRCIGMSSHNPVIARQAAESGLIDVIMFSSNPCYDMQPASEDLNRMWADESYANPLCNMDPDRQALFEVCERENVAITVMKPYGGGDLLDGKMSPFGVAFTPIQCLHYCLTRPAVATVLPGIHSDAEMDAVLAYPTATPQQRDYSGVLSSMTKFTFTGHCMYCGHCAPCPVGIDVASVNKYFNLTEAQGFVPETAAQHYAVLEHHAGECIACGACESRCPFDVPIMQYMQRAKERFGE